MGPAGGRFVTRRYASVAYPWRAAVDVSEPTPARVYLTLVRQALEFGLPARRRPAPLWTMAARHGIPERALARALRLPRGHARADLDELADGIGERWSDLAELSQRLPAQPGPLSVLSLERRAARTVFLCAAGRPVVVAKLPPPGDDRVDVELSALEQAAAAGVAPRPLGRVAGARLQEAIPGAPLRLRPVTPGTAAALGFPPELGKLADALAQLAQATRRPERNEELDEPVQRALGSGLLGERARERLTAAAATVAASETSVLRNRDTSVQNCLFEDGELTGIVDWEGAVAHGVPGFDMLNAALAYVEQGVGLTRWSQQAVLGAFAGAWRGPFGTAARDAAARCARAGGLGDAECEALTVAFLGWRVGRRLANPSFYPTTAETAALMLEMECAT